MCVSNKVANINVKVKASVSKATAAFSCLSIRHSWYE